ncbi:MAG: endolytic transglycosylase MltG [Clostridiales bacterium]|nr:endolytic transglycosylase MltG [Clostridiales bacterium]
MRKKRDYTYRTMRDERQYGPYWYSGLWNILRPVLVGLGAVIVVIGLVSAGWNMVYDTYLAPADIEDRTDIPFEVESGQSLTRVANNLEAAGLIRNRTVFKYYCDFAGMGQKIQSGNYLLQPSMTMQEIADQLTRGDGNPLVRNITMIPGWTLEDFAAKLVENEVLESADEFLALCRTGEKFSDFYYVADAMATTNAGQRKYMLEGYLAPNTYEVYTSAAAEDIIRKLLSQTERAFPADYQEYAAQQGFTMDQILTLASMIEKEAKNSDFTRVSAVFHNRLKQGMKLQSDVTIHYVTGVRKMSLDNNDLDTHSLYNTYENAGLPLGPICAPSVEAINAALFPDETYVAENYLYFCAKDPESGELYFSRTLKEHEQAVAIYAPLWKEYDQSRGIE